MKYVNIVYYIRRINSEQFYDHAIFDDRKVVGSRRIFVCFSQECGSMPGLGADVLRCSNLK